jgi:hypothetical protein
LSKLGTCSKTCHILITSKDWFVIRLYLPQMRLLLKAITFALSLAPPYGLPTVLFCNR